ncbi:hypothetical protein PR048_015719 [Dryococelus australis]|uniref:Uncharacterized protein n=1 Tax=Dryococelus australis TaxID=614101 RepID=A0ABQ9HHS4_9NEOP|nr:hypothetical protein PR048_015719 [Dryococelus australis]
MLHVVLDDAAGRRVFSGISHLPRPFIPALLHTHLNHHHRLSRSRCNEPPKSFHSFGGESPLNSSGRITKSHTQKDPAPKEIGDIDSRDIICWKTFSVHEGKADNTTGFQKCQYDHEQPIPSQPVDGDPCHRYVMRHISRPWRRRFYTNPSTQGTFQSLHDVGVEVLYTSDPNYLAAIKCAGIWFLPHSVLNSYSEKGSVRCDDTIPFVGANNSGIYPTRSVSNPGASPEAIRLYRDLRHLEMTHGRSLFQADCVAHVKRVSARVTKGGREARPSHLFHKHFAGTATCNSRVPAKEPPLIAGLRLVTSYFNYLNYDKNIAILLPWRIRLMRHRSVVRETLGSNPGYDMCVHLIAFSSPFPQRELGSIPGRFIPNFREWESCRMMSLVGGFTRGYPVPPALSFRRCSILAPLRPHRISRPPKSLHSLISPLPPSYLLYFYPRAERKRRPVTVNARQQYRTEVVACGELLQGKVVLAHNCTCSVHAAGANDHFGAQGNECVSTIHNKQTSPSVYVLRQSQTTCASAARDLGALRPFTVTNNFSEAVLTGNCARKPSGNTATAHCPLSLDRSESRVATFSPVRPCKNKSLHPLLFLTNLCHVYAYCAGQDTKQYKIVGPVKQGNSTTHEQRLAREKEREREMLQAYAQDVETYVRHFITEREHSQETQSLPDSDRRTVARRPPYTLDEGSGGIGIWVGGAASRLAPLVFARLPNRAPAAETAAWWTTLMCSTRGSVRRTRSPRQTVSLTWTARRSFRTTVRLFRKVRTRRLFSGIWHAREMSPGAGRTKAVRRMRVRAHICEPGGGSIHSLQPPVHGLICLLDMQFMVNHLKSKQLELLQINEFDSMSVETVLLHSVKLY